MLFTTDKSGKIRYWEVSIKENNSQIFIVKKFGQVGGKETTTQTEIKSGKNIGKKNETTKKEQAESEARSLVKKQLDSGYVTDRESLENRVLLLPMLANKYNGKISEPFYVQPKLDGVRMLLGKRDGKVVMLSRTGKPVHNMEHICKEVEPYLEEGEFLDGENYNPDLTFEEITGLCRTSLKDTGKKFDKIQFHIFDFFDLNNLNKSFENRLELLKKFKRNFKNIFFVETKLLKNKNLIQNQHDQYVSHGYEGIMLRDPKGKYTLANRSSHLLKFKTFQTDEYRIVGAEEARGRDVDTVVWICETDKGERFSVRPKGTQEQRKKWLAHCEKLIDGSKWLTVQFQNLTDGGIPRFPVGIAIRDYE